MPKRVDREEKKQQLMDTSVELFLQKGYKSVTTREIAETANVSKGILYHYFKNKDDLFYQTIREYMCKTHKFLCETKNDKHDPVERFRNLMNHCCSSKEEQEKHFRLMIDFIFYCPDKRLVQDLIHSIYRDVRLIITEILSEAFPDIHDKKVFLYLCSIIIAFLDGIHFQHFIDPSESNIDEANELFWKMVSEKLGHAKL